jgi:hypothetical protein
VPSQFDKYSFDEFHSNAGVRSDLFKRPLDKVLMTDFFGGVSDVEISDPAILPIHSGRSDEEVSYYPDTTKPAEKFSVPIAERTGERPPSEGHTKAGLVALGLLGIHGIAYSLSKRRNVSPSSSS